MRTPPPVRLVVPRCGAWCAGVCTACALAAAATAAWLLQGIDLPWGAVATGAAAAAAAAAPLGRRLDPCATGTLAWDGGRWSFSGVPGQLGVMIAFDRWLLARFQPAVGRAVWLAVGATSAGAAWHALRAAVYSPGSNDNTA